MNEHGVRMTGNNDQGGGLIVFGITLALLAYLAVGYGIFKMLM